MRISFLSIFMVFVLSFALLSIATAYGQDGCRCEGCGCKGGPGWRAPNGHCVSEARFAKVCGTPAGSPCVQEAAAQICFGTPDAEGPAQSPAPAP